MVDDDLREAVTRFHREVFLRDVERIVHERFAVTDGKIDSLRSEMLSHFDEIQRCFDRLDSQQEALSATFARMKTAILEDRVA